MPDIIPYYREIIELCKKEAVKVVNFYCQGNDERLQKDEYLTGQGWCLGMVVQWILYSQSGKNKEFWGNIYSKELEGKFRMPMAWQKLTLNFPNNVLSQQQDKFVLSMVAEVRNVIEQKQSSRDDIVEIIKETYQKKYPDSRPISEKEVQAIKSAYTNKIHAAQDRMQAVIRLLSTRGFYSQKNQLMSISSFKPSDKQKLLQQALAGNEDCVVISIGLARGGRHVFAIRKYQNDKYAFMDANSGEFLFDNQQQLHSWFRNYFDLYYRDTTDYYFQKLSSRSNASVTHNVSDLFSEAKVPTVANVNTQEKGNESDHKSDLSK